MGWIKTQDGTLALQGTVMQIVYQPRPSGNDFAIYQGDRFKQSTAILVFAKFEAERINCELLEIGAG